MGSVSGAKVDKSAVFEYEMGTAGSPIIKTKGFESFICTSDSTLVEEAFRASSSYDLRPLLVTFFTLSIQKTH